MSLERVGFHSLLASLSNRALGIAGAFLASAVLFAGTACELLAATPTWEKQTAHATPPAEVPTPEATAKPATEATASAEAVRFISYNVENWLTMDRFVDGKPLKGAPKPDSEKQAVTEILARHKPDILGLCEIGLASDLADIQQRLKAAGLDLPHSHHTGGSDPVRHLGILSRFPITSTSNSAILDYQLAGKTFQINRGILDATVEVHGKPYHFIGLHLKSKRDSEQGDQEAIRLNEVRLVRNHIDKLLKANPNERLIVYGDFNDTRGTPAIKLLVGKYSSPNYLTAIPMKDSRQMAWTHHWTAQDIYSRIDFIMVSQQMKMDVDFPASRIIDDTDWSEASDHRPTLAIFK
jgi:endonuclease/exonuclease/phosphatase family metal-dependent hydrolase